MCKSYNKSVVKSFPQGLQDLLLNAGAERRSMTPWCWCILYLGMVLVLVQRASPELMSLQPCKGQEVSWQDSALLLPHQESLPLTWPCPPVLSSSPVLDMALSSSPVL